MDSNHRPCAYQAHALTTWAISPYRCRMSEVGGQKWKSNIIELFVFCAPPLKSSMYLAIHCFSYVCGSSLNASFKTLDWCLIFSWVGDLDFFPKNVNILYKKNLGWLFLWRNNHLVEMRGFEPLTPCVQGRCSPSWATPPHICYMWISEFGTKFNVQWIIYNLQLWLKCSAFLRA